MDARTAATSGRSSTSILMNFESGYCFAKSVKMGEIVLHGPHLVGA